MVCRRKIRAQRFFFPHAVGRYKKEKHKTNNFIRHSQENPEDLNLATIEFISESAILRDNYYEKRTLDFPICSFTVTPNSTRLTRSSDDFSSLPTEAYGSIPVKIYKVAQNLELLICPNTKIKTEHRADYAQAMTQKRHFYGKD